jgi:formylglycine-generating enzyme required for sulfatase activity
LLFQEPPRSTRFLLPLLRRGIYTFFKSSQQIPDFSGPFDGISERVYGNFYLAGAPHGAGLARTAAVVQPAAEQPQQALPGMVRVEDGTFTIGDTHGGGQSNEKPLHQVTLSSFYMARTEVTQSAFQAVMGFNPSNFKGADLPVDSVTWYDAVAWCNAKSRQEGLQPVYRISGIQKNGVHIVSADVTANWSADGYRLPTEAEWEYAAKGGNESHGYE